MKIAGLQKLTLLDYPGKMACIIFTKGCNFNCDYCQNSELISLDGSDHIDEEELFTFLNKRKNILEGVVITGGEPTIHKDLKDFIYKIKKLGYKVKLDTNGCNPSMLKEIIEEKIIDYIAMDIKTTFDDYETVIRKKINIENIKESINLIKKSNIYYEFRTTIIKDIHSIDKIINICKIVGSNKKLYLQNFEQSENVRNKSLKSFTKEELNNIQKMISGKYPNVIVRNL